MTADRKHERKLEIIRANAAKIRAMKQQMQDEHNVFITEMRVNPHVYGPGYRDFMRQRQRRR